MKNFILSILCIVAIVVTWKIADRLVAVVEQTKTLHPVVRSLDSTNVCVCTSKAQTDNCMPDRARDYEEALQVLREEQTNWLALLGIFCAIFGLLIPAGGYLLQRQSLKDERDRLYDDIEKAQNLMKDNLTNAQDASRETLESMRKNFEMTIRDSRASLVAEIRNGLKPVWNFLAANFDQVLVNDGKWLWQKKFPNWETAANFIIGLDICLDCLVRAENNGRIVDIILKYRPHIDASRRQYPQEWAYAFERLMDKMRPSAEFLSGADYAALIGKDSKTFDWLKSFYDNFAPWKFA